MGKYLEYQKHPFDPSKYATGFSQSSVLVSHRRSIHINDRAYRCDQCAKGFNLKGSLDKHIRIVHTGDRPHKCDQCERTFSERSNFLNHYRTHTGEKPHKCSECGAAFAKSVRMESDFMNFKFALNLFSDKSGDSLPHAHRRTTA